MELGMIGLGRMGASIVRRLLRDGHHPIVYDLSTQAVTELVGEGAEGAATSRTWRPDSPGREPFG